MGIDPDRLDGTIVGVASTWTQTMPCNLNQRELSDAVVAAVDAAGGVGMAFNTIAVSDTAEYGDLSRGPRVIDEHVRDNMRKLLSDIREGTFAQDWIEQMSTGEAKLNELRQRASEERIETVGAELRSLMHRAPQPDPA